MTTAVVAVAAAVPFETSIVLTKRTGKPFFFEIGYRSEAVCNASISMGMGFLFEIFSGFFGRSMEFAEHLRVQGSCRGSNGKK